MFNFLTHAGLIDVNYIKCWSYTVSQEFSWTLVKQVLTLLWQSLKRYPERMLRNSMGWLDVAHKL